jgi:hypothetical protein
VRERLGAYTRICKVSQADSKRGDTVQVLQCTISALSPQNNGRSKEQTATQQAPSAELSSCPSSVRRLLRVLPAQVTFVHVRSLRFAAVPHLTEKPIVFFTTPPAPLAIAFFPWSRAGCREKQLRQLQFTSVCGRIDSPANPDRTCHTSSADLRRDEKDHLR